MTPANWSSKLSDQDLSISLLEAAGAVWQRSEALDSDHGSCLFLGLRVFARKDSCGTRELLVSTTASFELLRQNILPVICERGLWGEFNKLLVENWASRESTASDFSKFLLLGITERELAEACLKVLSIEDPRVTALKLEIETLGLDPNY